jgi:3-phenylpropionate/trans-cinnamate dioxygenase ferredoxin reductase component
MTTDQTFLIAGGGLAGAKAAETLRAEGFDGRLVLVGAEQVRPYERPPLSKEYLRGEAGRDKVYVHDEGFYAEQDIELRLGRTAVSLNASAGELALDDGERLRYDRLLLATGAEPRTLPIPGGDLDGVLYLRSVEDSDALRARLDRGGSVVVVGAGWIGAEVAASARQRGLDVTVLDPLSVPLERVLGKEMGAVYRDVHADHGVQMLMGTGVEAFEGAGAVERVRTSDGRELACDFVVVGVGVQPRTQLAAQAGLAVGDGVLVDEHLQTSAPGVFAAGDVAGAEHPFYGERIRVEHWANALHQGPAAARNMLGHDEPYDRLPYFFSDQYDVGMEYSGFARHWDRVVVRGDLAAREFVAFWMAEDRVVAGMNVNVWDVADPIRRLIGERVAVDDRRLADPGVALEDLAPVERGAS